MTADAQYNTPWRAPRKQELPQTFKEVCGRRRGLLRLFPVPRYKAKHARHAVEEKKQTLTPSVSHTTSGTNCYGTFGHAARARQDQTSPWCQQEGGAPTATGGLAVADTVGHSSTEPSIEAHPLDHFESSEEVDVATGPVLKISCGTPSLRQM